MIAAYGPLEEKEMERERSEMNEVRDGDQMEDKHKERITVRKKKMQIWNARKENKTERLLKGDCELVALQDL